MVKHIYIKKSKYKIYKVFLQSGEVSYAKLVEHGQLENHARK